MEENHRHSRKKKKRNRLDVSLEFVPPKEGHTGPFVGYFPSGFDPMHFKQELSQSEPTEMSDLKVLAYQNTEKYKTRQHQLVVNSPDGGTVDFVGTNYLGEGALWQPGNYALGIFDKDSQTLQLLPVSGTKVFRMEPRVRGLGYDVEALATLTNVEMSKDSMIQKRNLLTATFGTHKSRMMQNRYERGRVKEDDLGDKEEMGKFFQKAGEKISVLTMHEALQQANSSLKRNIPPHDVTASTHEKAYIFDEIITVEEQNCLDDIELLKSAIGNKVKINELREQRAYPEFVLQRLYTMKHLQDEQKNKGIVILSYLKHLLAFYRLPRHLINSIVDPMGSQAKLSGSNSIDLTRYANIPDAVAGKILKLFTTVSEDMTSESEARTQTDEKRDLLINYILVLGLMVDNYRADPYDLGVELKKTISQLRPYYLELGCKFKSVKEADRGVAEPKTSLQRLYEITLPLPLRFPTLKNKKRRV